MNTQTTTETNQMEIVIKMVLDAWTTHNKRVTDYMSKYPDETYMQEIAPGRNRAIYLIGHLIAVNDAMRPLLGIGDRLYPQLEEGFLKNPDKTIAELPSVAELRQYWETVNKSIEDYLRAMPASEWLERHTAASEEDFAANPQRNKMTIVSGRTNHQAYHMGQMNLLRA